MGESLEWLCRVNRGTNSSSQSKDIKEAKEDFAKVLECQSDLFPDVYEISEECYEAQYDGKIDDKTDQIIATVCKGSDVRKNFMEVSCCINAPEVIYNQQGCF